MEKAKRHCELLGFNDRWFRIIGIPLTAWLAPTLFFRGETLAQRPMPENFLVSLLFTTVIWEGCRRIFIAASARFPEIGQWRRRLGWMSFFAVLYSFLACSAVSFLLSKLGHGHSGMNLTEKYGAQLFLLLTVGAIYESARYFNLWQKTLTEKEKIEREHLAGQLTNLRNQVNPHFLFNSLNTLVYLIPEDSERAVRFVRQLSKVYRHSIESREARVVPLEEELDFLNAYVFLLRERFGENLQVSFGNLSEQKNAAVVPLALQLLFENAIKHNVISTEKPLKIEVFAENGHLIVRNNLQRKNQVMDSTGVGLENIRTRYHLLTGRDIQVIVSPDFFTVILPLIAYQMELGARVERIVD